MLCFSSLCIYKWRRQSDNHHPKRILIMNFYFMLNYFWNLFKTLCETVDALYIFLDRFAFFWLCNYKQKQKLSDTGEGQKGFSAHFALGNHPRSAQNKKFKRKSIRFLLHIPNID